MGKFGWFVVGWVLGGAVVASSRVRVIKHEGTRGAAPLSVEEFDELWDTAKTLKEDKGLALLGEVLDDLLGDWQGDSGEEDG